MRYGKFHPNEEDGSPDPECLALEDRRRAAERGPLGYRRIAMVSISISAPGRPNPGSGTPVDAPAGSR